VLGAVVNGIGIENAAATKRDEQAMSEPAPADTIPVASEGS